MFNTFRTNVYYLPLLPTVCVRTEASFGVQMYYDNFVFIEIKMITDITMAAPTYINVPILKIIIERSNINGWKDRHSPGHSYVHFTSDAAAVD